MNQVFDAYAAYYDLLYKDKDYVGEADFVRSLLIKYGTNASEILELGSGTGKHAMLLAEMGYRVQGVDLSQAMIDTANAKISSNLYDKISFVQGDVRTVRLDKKFDAVISLFHVASYQISNNDISAMLETAAEHLNSGGIFVFDFWYGPAVLTDRPAVRTKRMSDNRFNILRIAEPTMFANENRVDVNYSILITSDNDTKTQTIQEEHQMRYFFAPELQILLKKSGFELINLVEWGTGNEPGFDTWSATVIAVRS